MVQVAADKHENKKEEEFSDSEKALAKRDDVPIKSTEETGKPKSGWDKALDFLKENPAVVKEYVQMFSDEFWRHRQPKIEYDRAEQTGKWRVTILGLIIVLTIISVAAILGYYRNLEGESVAFIFGVVLGFIFGFLGQLHPLIIREEE